MTDAIEIRELVDSDLPEVLELQRVSLGESQHVERSAEQFHWKHRDNPFGTSIGLVATSSGRIVGLRTFMRWRLRDGEAHIDCVRPVDTATHPDFQRMGIFRDLTMSAIEVARDQSVHLVFNTPNEKSRPGYLKMGWSVVGEISVLAVIRPIGWLGKRGLESEQEGQREVVVDGLEPRQRSGLHTLQTDDYLRWRYQSNPGVRYHGFGDQGSTAVCRRDARMGRVGLAVSDVYGDSPSAALRSARSSTKASYLVCSFESGSQERTAAMRAGFMPVPGVTALTLVALPLADIDSDPLDRSSWELALTDLELL